ncbi:MAG TPA: type II toxin-antitoxin system HigB family toxin [Gammaproteobacteria bacterium]|nr:type II toxin-antitoxin system HigB family toxin [Gammaproteobacteria bacterium]
MILIGKKEIVAFGSSHPQSRRPLAVWEGIIKQTNYANFNELKQTFPSADYVYHQYTIFNIGGNKFRLISEINYSASVVYVKRIWTHAEYSMKTNEAALRRNMI